MANVNENFNIKAPMPSDRRLGKWVSGSWKPFDSRQEALDSTPYYRYETLTLPVLEDGEVVEYWFIGGIEEHHFVLKTAQVDLSQFYTKANLQTAGEASVHWDNLIGVPSFSFSWGDITGNQSVIGVAGFTNDAGYITLADIPSIPTKTSDLTNDGENGLNPFITASDLPDLSTFLQTGDEISKLTNDVGYLTSVSWGDIGGVQSAVEVGGFSNSVGYITLAEVPGQIQPDWDATSGLGQILNKPNLATVAISGSYSDLSDKPTIPDLTGYATESWVLSQGYISSVTSSWDVNSGDLVIQGDTRNLDGRYMLRSNTITAGYGISSSANFNNPVSIEVNTSVLDNRYLRKDVNDDNDTFGLTLGTLSAGNTTLTGSVTISSVPVGTGDEVLLYGAGGVVQRKTLSILGSFGVANSTGTKQFDVNLGDNLRFQGAGDTSISYNPSTNTVIINSVPGSGTGGAVTSFNGRDGAVNPELGDYTTSIVSEGTNLYFTNARVLATALAGFSATNSAISASDTVLSAFGKAQGQISARALSATTMNVQGTAGNITVSGGAQSLAANRTWTVNLASVGTAGTYTKVTTDAQGRVTAGAALTLADLPNIATQRILGRGATGSGNIQELTLGSNLTLSTAGVLSATNTTYTNMSSAELNTGTATTARTISAKTLTDWLNGKNYFVTPSGTTSQYVRGNGTLATFPTIPTVNNGTLTMNTTGIASGSATFTANQSGNSTFTVNVPAQNLSLGANPGGINISGGSGVNLTDLTVASKQDANTRTLASVFQPYRTVSGMVNYPTTSIGTGFRIERFSSASSQIGMEFYTNGTTSSGFSNIFYRVFSGESAYSGWESIASKGWVTAQIPTNYVTTNSTQTGITGNKVWLRGHTWALEQNYTPTSAPQSFGIGRNSNGVYLGLRGLDGATNAVAIRSYSDSGIQMALREGGIDIPVGTSNSTPGYYIGGNVVLGSSSNYTLLSAPTESGIVYIYPNGRGNLTSRSIFTPNNTTIGTLTGTGTQMVVANASGVLSRQAIPAVGVTSVSAGNGLNFTTITGTGAVTLGTPGTLTASTSNAVTSTSHTHSITTTTSGAANTIVQTNASGVITASGGNSTQWNTAFGWGDFRDFGLGTTGRLPTAMGASADDMDLIPRSVSGFIYGSNTSLNMPNLNYPLGIHIGHNVNISAQLLIDRNGNLFTRGSGASSNWNPWVTMWHSGNLANGTTSQYIRGDGSLATFPTDLVPTSRTITAGTGLTGGGALTGNITINHAAHTGDVTGSTALTIANSAVTYAKFQNVPTQTLLGRGATGTGNVGAITLGANLSLSTAGVLSATNTTYTAGNGLTGTTTFSVDGTVVRTSGAQSIAGVKTFSDELIAHSVRLNTGSMTGTSINMASTGLIRMASISSNTTYSMANNADGRQVQCLVSNTGASTVSINVTGATLLGGNTLRAGGTAVLSIINFGSSNTVFTLITQL